MDAQDGKNTNLVEMPSSFEELKLLIRSGQQIEQGQQVETWAVYTRLSREETQGHSYSLESTCPGEAYARDKGIQSRSIAIHTKRVRQPPQNCKN